MKLNDIRDNAGAHTRFRAIGRGIGSGKGKTSGRGGKGQSARSGYSINGFEGGQTPLHRRLPKRGFNRTFLRADYRTVNLGRIQAAIDAGRIAAGADLDGAALIAAGVLHRAGDGVRLLATGEIKAPLTITVAGASKAAVAAVEKAGGKVIVTGAAGHGGEIASPAVWHRWKAGPPGIRCRRFLPFAGRIARSIRLASGQSNGIRR